LFTSVKCDKKAPLKARSGSGRHLAPNRSEGIGQMQVAPTLKALWGASLPEALGIPNQELDEPDQ
jgi:hypothetical protein